MEAKETGPGSPRFYTPGHDVGKLHADSRAAPD